MDFEYYTDMSLWDTFRTTHPLFTLLTPKRHRDMLVSLVKMAEQGGNLPLLAVRRRLYEFHVRRAGRCRNRRCLAQGHSRISMWKRHTK
jgi:hypothetical protein